ncbi:hypothetical protein HK100_011808 [Physocladia obscura]|uniref:UspA domain-containing protein n=1 Tax=Physocladia obscura TaxID=109957 RepID=A0AAD5T6P6_9FUNG|nr:hypothetical protein HK100_011808 [Physocladia obscura]
MRSAHSRNIFVAVDESTHSVAAFVWVLEYIKLADGDIVTVVVGIDSESERATTLERIKSLIRAIADPYHLKYQYAVQIIISGGGGFGAKLVELVDEKLPDLLVLGSAGKSHMECFFVGSVSNYAILYANVPVIVARLTPADEVQAEKNAASKSLSPMFNHPLWL